MHLSVLKEKWSRETYHVWASLEPLEEGEDPSKLSECFIVGSGSSKELAIIAACDVMSDAVEKLRKANFQ